MIKFKVPCKKSWSHIWFWSHRLKILKLQLMLSFALALIMQSIYIWISQSALSHLQLVQKAVAICKMQSADQLLLSTPCTLLKTRGYWEVSIVGPKMWHRLLQTIISPPSTDTVTSGMFWGHGLAVTLWAAWRGHWWAHRVYHRLYHLLCRLHCSSWDCTMLHE